MKIETYSHPDHKHKYMIAEEVLHYGGQMWTMQQLDERGTITSKDIRLSKAEYENMVKQLNEQGWKTLLEG